MWEVNVDLTQLHPNIKQICPFCGGSGKLRAKRKVMQFNGPPVDYDEVPVQCTYCNGTGYRSSNSSAPRSRSMV